MQNPDPELLISSSDEDDTESQEEEQAVPALPALHVGATGALVRALVSGRGASRVVTLRNGFAEKGNWSRELCARNDRFRTALALAIEGRRKRMTTKLLQLGVFADTCKILPAPALKIASWCDVLTYFPCAAGRRG